jgi:phospholipase C
MSAASSNDALGRLPFDEGLTGGGKGKKGDAAVKHVVVLMLENRSFDNALGYLDSHHPFDGLHPTSSSSHATTLRTGDVDLAQERESKAAEDGRSSSGTSEAKEELKMNRAYFNTTSGPAGGVETVWPEPKAQFYTPVDPPHSHKEIMEQMFGEGRVPPSFHPQDRASSTPPKVH